MNTTGHDHRATIGAAWRELLGTPVATLEIDLGVEVLVIQPPPDEEPFSYLATVGLSDAAGANAFELLIAIAGRHTVGELAGLGNRLVALGGMGPMPGRVLALDGLSPFDRMPAVLVADYVPGEIEWLAAPSGRVRVLSVWPLFSSESDAATLLGDIEIMRLSHRTKVDLMDPGRAPLAIETLALGRIWADVEGWLREHAPRVAEGLREGATDALLDELSDQLGLTLPADYRASLARHDGGGSLGGYEYLRADSVSSVAQGMAAVDPAWRRTFIPFASDGCGNLFCIDVGESPGVVSFERESGCQSEVARLRSRTFTAWLARYRDDLLAGGVYAADEDGLVTPL